MSNAVIVTTVVVAYFLVLGGLPAGVGGDGRARDAEWDRRQAGRDADHDAQMADLAHHRYLRELEERRSGFLRGRDRPCRFCGVPQGCLTPDGVCMDVEACFDRAGVPGPRPLGD
jgi:hypothetical protein